MQPRRGLVPGAEQEVGGAQEDPGQDSGRDHGQEDILGDYQVSEDQFRVSCFETRRKRVLRHLFVGANAS